MKSNLEDLCSYLGDIGNNESSTSMAFKRDASILKLQSETSEMGGKTPGFAKK